MPQLNRSMIQLVYAYLGGEHFTSMDFDVKFPDGGGTLVDITLVERPTYRFSISEEQDFMAALSAGGMKKTQSIPTTTETPGDAKATERHAYSSVASAIERIPHWVKNVYADLRVRTPVFREVDSLQAMLEEQIKAHIQDPESHLSAEELARLTTGLEALTEGFEKLEAEHQITKSELDGLRQEIEAIRRAASDVPKGVWARLTKNRLVRMGERLATSEEGRKFLFGAAKQYWLGDSSGSSGASE